MIEPELLACPFCKDEVVINGGGEFSRNRYWVDCDGDDGCGASGPLETTAIKAAERWNRGARNPT